MRGYNMNWSDYSYASDGSIMVVLIIILGALAAYLLLDKNTRTNKWSDKQDAWSGEDIQPDYNAGQDESPFNDPEVPSRPKKSKKRKKKTVAPKKRGYLPVVRNQKKKRKKTRLVH